MSDLIKFEGVEYQISELNEESRKLISLIQNVEKRISEHQQLNSALVQAKDSYKNELKQIILAETAGIDFLD